MSPAPSPGSAISYRRLVVAVSLSIGTILFYTILSALLCYSILDIVSPHPKLNAGGYQSRKNVANEMVTPRNNVSTQNLTGNQNSPATENLTTSLTNSSQSVNNPNADKSDGVPRSNLPNAQPLSSQSQNIPILQSEDGSVTIALDVHFNKPNNLSTQAARPRTSGNTVPNKK